MTKTTEPLRPAVQAELEQLIQRYPALEAARTDILCAYRILEGCYLAGGKLLIAGNGGSAADAEHIVGELMKGFCRKRPLDEAFSRQLCAASPQLGPVLAQSLQGALPAIALDGQLALSTAFLNDCDPLLCFAQQVNGYGKAGDVFWGISTSGNSKNVLYAAAVARAKGMPVIGLTGQGASGLSEAADVCIRVPEKETYRIQEYHLPVYHCLCLMIENRFWEV